MSVDIPPAFVPIILGGRLGSFFVLMPARTSCRCS